MRPSEQAFTRTNSLFYTEPDEIDKSVGMEDAPECYVVELGSHAQDWKFVDNGPWRNVIAPEAMPDQGWKIHVSALPARAQHVLDIAAEILLDSKTNFKFLRTPDIFRSSLAKYGDRIQCGKFIAAYPATDELCVALLDELARRLHAEPGPVVLGDARWGEAPVYFRFGGFARRTLQDLELGEIPAIRDPDGRLVADQRSVAWSVPDWVDVPSPMQPWVAARLADNVDPSCWRPYRIDQALHFSNAGGVYLGHDETQNCPVVLKEARPHVGLDDAGDWAQDRLQHEAATLRALDDVQGVVGLRETREIGGHLFLVEDYVPGVTLSTWIAQRYPFSRTQPAAQYVQTATRLCHRLREIVTDVHRAGVALLDLQPMNIMVDESGEPTIIDLEAARPIDSAVERAIGTPGFVAPDGVDARHHDWFAYNRVVAHLFFPLVPLNAVSDHLVDVQKAEAIRNLSSSIPFETLLVPESSDMRRDDVGTLWTETDKIDSASLRLSLIKGIDAVTTVGEGRTEIPGDILAFSTLGRVSVGTGIAGAPSTETVCSGVRRAAEELLTGKDLKRAPRGYLDGVDGLLLRAGHPLTSVTLSEFDAHDSRLGLRSGVSGAVLARIASGMTHGDLERDSEIPRLVEILLAAVADEDRELASPGRLSRVAVGLVDGWTAVALALDVAARIFRDEKIHASAGAAIARDLQKTVIAPDGSRQVLDETRLMPYLAEGAAGILFALMLGSEPLRASVPPAVLRELAGATEVRCTANGGLFMGRSGLTVTRAIASRNGVDCPPVSADDLTQDLMPYCFVVPGNQGALMGGQGGLRLSADYSSGNSGAVRAIDVVLGDLHPWGLFPGLEVLHAAEDVA